ncbi:hypothetical protein HanRHA438_Chr11g0518461 [Helianthus annuus]|nr:hypothetical protein HanRHA438_Chr11g0518461 [Helianthus annuus]
MEIMRLAHLDGHDPLTIQVHHQTAIFGGRTKKNLSRLGGCDQEEKRKRIGSRFKAAIKDSSPGSQRVSVLVLIYFMLFEPMNMICYLFETYFFLVTMVLG